MKTDKKVRYVSTKPHYIFGRALLRGVGQVMFQNNSITGALFLLGIIWGAYVARNDAVAWGALLGLLVSTFTGKIFRQPTTDRDAGLWGFNGVLVGCAFPTFFAPTPLMWVSLIIAAAMTTILRRALNKMLAPWKVNSLTFPFVLITWIFLMAAHMMHALPASHIITIPWHIDHWGPIELIIAWLTGISQVFLIDNWITGAIFLIALCISSRRAAIWAAIASALALCIAIVWHAPEHAILSGLYGYSAVLTGIAIGATFYKPNWRVSLYTLFAIVVTIFIQAALNSLLHPYGIATLTAPFCVATWCFLLPLYKFNDTHANHSGW
jgi:urea transporter